MTRWLLFALVGAAFFGACFLLPDDSDPDEAFEYEIELVDEEAAAADSDAIAPGPGALPGGGPGAARGGPTARVDRPLPVVLVDQDDDGYRFEIDENQLRGLLPHDRVAFRGVYLTRGRVVDLDLRRQNVVDENCVIAADGRPLPVRADHLVTCWTGTVVGESDSFVQLTLSRYGTRGFVRIGADTDELVAVPAEDGNWDRSRIWLRDARRFETPPPPSRCGNRTTESIPPLDPSFGRDARVRPWPTRDGVEVIQGEGGASGDGQGDDSTPPPPDGGPQMLAAAYEVGVAVMTDYEMYEYFKSEAALFAWVASKIGWSSPTLETAVSTQLKIVHVDFATTPNDGFSDTNEANVLLKEFREGKWGAGKAQFGADVHYLFSGVKWQKTPAEIDAGKDPAYGRAHLGMLCDPYYSFGMQHTGIGNPVSDGSYSWDFNTCLHELGHLFGAPHTHQCLEQPYGSGNFFTHEGLVEPCTKNDCVPNPASASQWSVMSYCYKSGGSTYFHPYSIDLMKKEIGTSCVGSTPVDLIAYAIDVPTIVKSDTPTAVTYSVTNNGVPYSGPVQGSLWLKPWNEEPKFLASLSDASFKHPTETYSYTLTIPAGNSDKAHQLMLKVNVVTDEVELQNNELLSASFFVDDPKVPTDLVAVKCAGPSGDVKANDWIKISASSANIGGPLPPASFWITCGYRSSTSNETTTMPGDTVLKSANLTNLNGIGDFDPLFMFYMLPIPPGTYRWIVKFGPAVGEQNLTNNVAIGSTFTVGGGSQGNNADLAAVSINGPSSVTAGEAVSVQVDFTEVAGPTKGPYAIAVYARKDGNEAISLSHTATSIGPVTVTGTVPADAEPGTYTWEAGVVGHVPGNGSQQVFVDADTTNDFVTGNAVTVNGATKPVPDLVAKSVSGPSSADPGTSVTVTRDLDDLAGLVGSADYRLVLSTDSTITASDQTVANFSTSSLGSGNVTSTIPFSTQPGAYTWGLVVDPAPGETNLGNNAVAGNAVQIGGGPTNQKDAKIVSVYGAPKVKNKKWADVEVKVKPYDKDEKFKIHLYLVKDEFDPGYYLDTFKEDGSGTHDHEVKIKKIKEPGEYYWKAVIEQYGEPQQLTGNNATIGNKVKVKKKKKK